MKGVRDVVSKKTTKAPIIMMSHYSPPTGKNHWHKNTDLTTDGQNPININIVRARVTFGKLLKASEYEKKRG